jgi:hypothetical protein
MTLEDVDGVFSGMGGDAPGQTGVEAPPSRNPGDLIPVGLCTFPESSEFVQAEDRRPETLRRLTQHGIHEPLGTADGKSKNEMTDVTRASGIQVRFPYIQ